MAAFTILRNAEGWQGGEGSEKKADEHEGGGETDSQYRTQQEEEHNTHRRSVREYSAQLVVGNGYALGSISETSREIASSPVVHESSTNQIDRDRIGCDGRRISPLASVSRVDPPSRLSQEEVPQTVQIVIEHPAERASTEVSLRSHRIDEHQGSTTDSLDNEKKQPNDHAHHQVIDIQDPSMGVNRLPEEEEEEAICPYCSMELDLPKEIPDLHYCTNVKNREDEMTSDEMGVVYRLISNEFKRASAARTQDRIPARPTRSTAVIPIRNNNRGRPDAIFDVDSESDDTPSCSRVGVSATAIILTGCMIVWTLTNQHGIQ
ncbi:hypothetical protein Pst134EA_031277 [Puccinia striiformis f. sp. tritici]|uniref:uncharacterized protein n=1 Tax=Puccinia striiformis f. sp. tritici TaxID=168172 RepID=UPI002008A162|nr:uncharacterized protein Pst134EA_031277 [Puccinia striiformis f. sp. tritici]KAH9443401.1 hypothetical protein Pst134EA_031277 [Puccinia striiformis f. sp. tritici]